MRITPTGSVTMSNNNIKDMAYPIDSQDSANKDYVDLSQSSLLTTINNHIQVDEDLDPNNEIELPIGGTFYGSMDLHGFVGTELCGDGEIIAEVVEVVGNGFCPFGSRHGSQWGKQYGGYCKSAS